MAAFVGANFVATIFLAWAPSFLVDKFHFGLVDAGLYAEQGYASNWIGTVNYEHRWRFDPLTEFRYGVFLMRRVYDGSVENTLGFIIGLRQRI